MWGLHLIVIITPHKWYCRVVLKHDLTQADFSKHELTKRFNVYLNFTFKCRPTGWYTNENWLADKKRYMSWLSLCATVDLAIDVLRKNYVIWTLKQPVELSLRIITYSRHKEMQRATGTLREECNRKYKHKWGKMYLTFERK